MNHESAKQLAAKAGELLIGDDLRVTRLGFGAMRITGKGVWGQPSDRAEAIRVLRRAVELCRTATASPIADRKMSWIANSIKSAPFRGSRWRQAGCPAQAVLPVTPQ